MDVRHASRGSLYAVLTVLVLGGYPFTRAQNSSVSDADLAKELQNPVHGWIYGVGPVLRLPTATRRDLGQGVWGAGPTGVALYQGEAWTFGMLANHVWSFAGRQGASVNATYLQPFVSYTTASSSSFGLGSESGNDWRTRRWIVPLDVSYSKLVRIGASPVNFSFALRKYLERPAGGPDWGATFTVTFMFPTKKV